MVELHKLWTNHKGESITAIVTLLVSRIIPRIWKAICDLASSVLARFGGRFAFASFRRKYLGWVINELRELKITGIVTSDGAKKPQLEQVFISLRLEEQRGSLSVAATFTALIDSIPSTGPIPASTVSSIREHLELASPELRKDAEQRLISRCGVKRWAIPPWVRRSRFQTVEAVLFSLSQRASHSLPPNIGLFQLRKALLEHKHMAILGDPGAGKTTLLQYIALSYARDKASDRSRKRGDSLRKRLGKTEWRLPIFISLNTVGRDLQARSAEGKSKSILDIVEMGLPPDLQTPVAAKFFKHYLSRQKCILLLDGLDEVPSDTEFTAVTRAIESLAAMYPENQIIVSSRIAGWRAGLKSEFVQYFVNDLDDDQINNFIDTWYAAMGVNSIVGNIKDESESERVHRERTAAKQATSLKRELGETPSIRLLASNPMLLSIIALVHKSVASLPRERSKLYEECVSILLDQWETSKGIKEGYSNLTLAQRETLLRKIAFDLHTGNIGTEGGGRTARKEQILNVIENILPSLGRKRDLAPVLLQQFISRSGLLIERQRNVYAFSHLTFQEYFTAQYLAIGDGLKQSLPFLFEGGRAISDWWREVVLLYASMVRDAGELIRKLSALTTSEATRQELRVALQCLAEATQVKREELRRTVTDEAARIALRGEFREIGEELPHEAVVYLSRWSRTSEWEVSAIIFALSMGRVEFFPEISFGIGHFLKDERSNEVLKGLELVEALGQFSLDAEIFKRLERLCSNSKADVRLRAVQCLASRRNEAGSSNLIQVFRNAQSQNHTNVIVRLLHLCMSDCELYRALTDEIVESLSHSAWTVRLSACKAVAAQGVHATNAQLDGFFAACSDIDSDVRHIARDALATLIISRNTISPIERSIALLRSDDSYLRCIAGEALSGLSDDSPTTRSAINCLWNVARIDPVADVAGVAFRSLDVMCSFEPIRMYVTSLLTFPKDLSQFAVSMRKADQTTRRMATFAVGILDKSATDMSFLVPLKEAANDRDPVVRSNALRALRKRAPKGDSEITSLAVRRISDQSALVARAGCELLKHSGACDESAAQALITAVSSIGTLDFIGSLRIKAIARLRGRANPYLQGKARVAAVEAVAACTLSESVRNIVHEYLNSERDMTYQRLLAGSIMMDFAIKLGMGEALRSFLQQYGSIVVGTDWIADNDEAVLDDGGFTFGRGFPIPGHSIQKLIELARVIPYEEARDILKDALQGFGTASKYAGLRVIYAMGRDLRRDLRHEIAHLLRDDNALIQKLAWDNYVLTQKALGIWVATNSQQASADATGTS